MTKIEGYIRLVRPANLPTAMADIIAGAMVSMTLYYPAASITATIYGQFDSMLLLCLCSVLLYASGVVLNDYFDRETDANERPERPIPCGAVTAGEALIFGMVLMITGVALSFTVSSLSGMLALLLAFAIVLYDALAKHDVLFGPLTMGVCRGVNLLLGMSLFGELSLWWMAFIPIVYIGAITLVSRGEVSGKNRSHIVMAFLMYMLVLCSIFALKYFGEVPFTYVLPFLFGFAAMILIPLHRAYKRNTPDNIRKAVRSGVLSLILLDACIAVTFAGWTAGLSIIILLPASLFLAKQFAVT